MTDDSTPLSSPFELEAMSYAERYYVWLAERFRTRLSGTVVEHGAGTGLLSARLRATGVAPLVLTEPDPALASGLRERFAGHDGFEIFQGTLEDFADDRGEAAADAVVSANVLEHVPDDIACLEVIRRTLKPGGHLCLYVPARPELFGTLDESFHHYRRYGRDDLREKLTNAGFVEVEVGYRNLANALPWMFAGRVMGSVTINTDLVRFYDRYCFPWLRRLEDLIPPPYGANLLATARKPLNRRSAP